VQVHAENFDETAPLPPPLLSSSFRYWNDIAVELHHFRKVDVVIPVREHLLGVHLCGSVNLLQSRGGRTHVRRVRAGETTITSAGAPKRFQHGGDNVVILVRLAPAFVHGLAGEEYAQDPSRFEVLDNPGTPDPTLLALGNALLAGLGLEGFPARMRVDSLKVQLATHLLRHYCTAPPASSRPLPRLSPHRLQRALDYIDSNLREDISLAQVAQALAMSPSHFAHAFRQTTGIPPHRFVLGRRIEHAKSLLRETDLPITEIAHRIGCANPSHFSMMFHRTTGQSPRDFRS
jgi:AraC family transcriptional regulator